ncbi:MAG: S-layer homology domain-containing protein [Clostridia bacterium]|nr:S-layer homology domain-containing protein [Clostridia bacterium]
MRKTLTRVFASLLCIAMLATCAFMASAAEEFSDVKSSNWFYDYVTYMASKGIINGYPDGTFGPNKNVNRSEFVTMMVNTFGLTAEKSINYNDVKSSNWYYDYYSKAAAQGFLTEVFTGNTMRPTEELTREEAAALLMAYMEYPEDEKASTSKFEDYDEISSSYKDYVLQAAKAGIIDGIEEDGDFYFRPDDTLTRAQAAKILSVAAGTIADDDIEDELESGVSENLVVTKACTIENIDIPGNVIIAEGATGTVTFMNCDIEGTVSVRSKAKVVFTNGYVEEINLDIVSANIVVKQSVEVDTINAYNASATIAVETDASVSQLNVHSGSNSVKVTGTSGEIETLVVKANSFTSTITPDECEVDSSVSATIGGVSYKNGLKGNITSYWDDGKEYLSFETYKDGSIQYYYLTSSSVSKANFATGYKNATKKGAITVKNGESMKKEIAGDTVSTSDFKYVAVAFVNDTTVLSDPVVINRTNTKLSFSGTPTITDSNGKDYLKGTAATTGTLYYYYTSSSTVPASYSEAETAYIVAESAYKGTISAKSTSVASALKVESTDASYEYIVVYLRGDNDRKYDPVIIKKTIKVETPKFAPYILTTSEDGYDYLVITHTAKALVKILYNDSAMNYDGSAFDAEYNANNKTPTDGSTKLSYSGYTEANKETRIKLAKSSEVNGYSTALVRIGSSAPEKIDRIDDADGFNDNAIPSALKTTGKDIIAFTPYAGAKHGDKVMYMYVSASKNYTSEAFLEAYADVADELKGTVDATGGYYKFSSDEKSSDISEGYIAFMFIGSGRNYQPVTVARGTIGTCIQGEPVVVYDVDAGTALITLNAKVPFTLQYFPIDENIYSMELLAVMFNSGRMPDGETPLNIGKLDSGSSTTNKVVAGKNENLDLNENKTVVAETSKYLAIRAVSENGATNYNPMVVAIKTIDDGIVGGATPDISFASDDGKIEITINASKNAEGKIFKFWYTNTEPKTEAQYNAIFKETKNSGSWPIGSILTSTSFEAGKWIDLADYKYLVYKVVDSTGKSMTPGYKTIPVKFRANADIKADGTTLSLIHVKPCDTEKYTVYWFYSTTEVAVTRSNFNSKYSSVANAYKGSKTDVKVSSANNEDFPIVTNFAQPEGTNAVKYKYIYVCLYDTTLKKFYQPVELKVPGTYTIG